MRSILILLMIYICSCSELHIVQISKVEYNNLLKDSIGLDVNCIMNNVDITKDAITIKSSSKQMLTFANDSIRQYNYIGLLPSSNYYLLRYSDYNEEYYFAIDPLNEDVISFDRFIQIGPDGTIITYNQPDFDSFNRIVIYKYKNHKYKKVGNMKDNTWYPLNVFWVSNNVIIIEAYDVKGIQTNYKLILKRR